MRSTREYDEQSDSFPRSLGRVLSYLTLHQQGLPSFPPPAGGRNWWSLTPPFHPYPDKSGRFVFCGTIFPLRELRVTKYFAPGVRTFLPAPIFKHDYTIKLYKTKYLQRRECYPVHLDACLLRLGAQTGDTSGAKTGRDQQVLCLFKNRCWAIV